MKKMVCMTLLLAIVITAGFCEEFKLHSDITFNMTASEVEKRESEAGYIVENGKGGFWGNVNKSKVLCIEAENLLGMGGKVIYDFADETQKVNMCAYILNDEYSAQDALNLLEAYINKYGEPLVRDSGYLDFEGQASDAMDHYMGLTSVMTETKTSKWSIENFCQWIIEQEDGSAVEIMFLDSMFTSKMQGFTIELPNLCITYSYRNLDEVQQFIDSIQGVQIDNNNPDI